MANFNSKVKNGSTTRTHEGAKAYVRSPKQELYIAAISDFVSGNTFYEDRSDKNARLVELTRKVTKSDPQWVMNFVKWLRNEANMRSVSVLVGVEAALASDSKEFSGRKILAGAMSRADEPGEALSYFRSNYPGKSIPAAIKRAVADAAGKLYNEYSVLKYDSGAREFRFGDVINLTHPKPEGPKQEQVFKLALDRRYNNVQTLTGSSLLSMQRNREEFKALTDAQKVEIVKSENGSAILKAAGLTWENVLSDVKAEKKDLWEALIPTMGYMALLRNLRNFEDADISKKSWNIVYNRLSDADEVARSRQLPFRFLSAHKNVSSSHNKLKDVLETALVHSVGNLDGLDGNTLIFLDLSGSMWYGTSDRSQIHFYETAGVFAYVLAQIAEKATLVGFGSDSRKMTIPKKFEGVLHRVGNLRVMGGTDFESAVAQHYTPGKYDRVVVLTDEQYYGGWGRSNRSAYSDIKEDTYVWNLVGYREASSATGNQKVHQLGGLSAESFRMIPLIEAGEKGEFPWEK